MNFLIFRLSGENLDLTEISEKIKLLPDISYKKGDVSNYKGKEIVYDEDVWRYSLEIENELLLVDEVERFLTYLKKHNKDVISLSKKYDATLWLTIYQSNYQYNLHLPNHLMRVVADLNINLDITFMTLGDTSQ